MLLWQVVLFPNMYDSSREVILKPVTQSHCLMTADILSTFLLRKCSKNFMMYAMIAGMYIAV